VGNYASFWFYCAFCKQRPMWWQSNRTFQHYLHIRWRDQHSSSQYDNKWSISKLGKMDPKAFTLASTILKFSIVSVKIIAEEFMVVANKANCGLKEWYCSIQRHSLSREGANKLLPSYCKMHSKQKGMSWKCNIRGQRNVS